VKGEGGAAPAADTVIGVGFLKSGEMIKFLLPGRLHECIKKSTKVQKYESTKNKRD
jgi:hypothetical protein